MKKELLKQWKKEKNTYYKMIEMACGNKIILNNYIVSELQNAGLYFDWFAGSDVYYTDDNGEKISAKQYDKIIENGGEAYKNFCEIYQYYIISGNDAEFLKEYTNELILYNSEIDLYILCVTHWGTSWNCVPANWKNPEEVEE